MVSKKLALDLHELNRLKKSFERKHGAGSVPKSLVEDIIDTETIIKDYEKR